ncbi:hypothetical protein PybrP1_006028 [[Pythium] brassicae (nom. inval.)]|nr:hypothetical protein PybrP1_006028 [[Pythium] brassicae (nom. inval.)]
MHVHESITCQFAMKRKKKPLPKPPALTYSTVVCPLARLQPHPLLRKEIERTSAYQHQVRLEAWRVANLHCLRCCELKQEFSPTRKSARVWLTGAARLTWSLAGRSRSTVPSAQDPSPIAP